MLVFDHKITIVAETILEISLKTGFRRFSKVIFNISALSFSQFASFDCCILTYGTFSAY